MNNLIRIALAGSISGVILFGVEKLVTHYLKENKNSKTSYVVAANLSYDALFLGHCMPAFTVSPNAFDSVTGMNSFNLAQLEASYAENLIMLHLYLMNNPTPEYLFLSATPESFDRNFNDFHAYRYAQFLDDTLVRSIVELEDPEFYRWSFLPYMKFGFYNSEISFNALQGWKHKRNNRSKPYFTDGLELPKDELGNRPFEKLSYAKAYQFTWDETLAEYFDRIVKMAQDHGITIILFETPLNKELSNPDMLPNRKEYLSRIDSIADKNKLRFWRFDESELTESLENYYSTLNLKYPAVLRFSKELGERFKEEYGGDRTKRNE